MEDGSEIVFWIWMLIEIAKFKIITADIEGVIDGEDVTVMLNNVGIFLYLTWIA